MRACRRGPRAAAGARRGSCSGPAARRPRPTRGGRPGAPSSSRRNAPIGVSRSAVRVARRRIVSAEPARRFVSRRLSGSAAVMRGRRLRASRESETTFVSGTKGRAFRGATLIRRVPHSDRRVVGRPADRSALPCNRWRSAPEPTGVRGLGAPRSVRRLPGPFTVVVRPGSLDPPAAGSLCPGRVDGYSSRSQPFCHLLSPGALSRGQPERVTGHAPSPRLARA
jgi:hypothetical protein